MKISARLLITLAFCVLVLPFIVKNYFLSGKGQQITNEKNYQNEITKIEEGSKNYKDQLLTSVEELPFEDTALKKCVIDNISKYFGISDSKGLLQSAADLKSLECHRQGITSLEGLTSLKKLETISLSDNDIEDASPLARVDSLRTINLSYGNKSISNIEELAQLNNLTNIRFPDLKQTFCYEIDRIIESMKDNSKSKITHNAKNIDCRGKKTNFVIKALRRQSNGEELTSEQSEALSDYEENQSWSN